MPFSENFAPAFTQSQVCHCIWYILWQTCNRKSQVCLSMYSVSLFLKTSWRKRLQRNKVPSSKTSSRRLLAKTYGKRLEDALQDKKMLHWRRFQYVFTKPNVCLVFYWTLGIKRLMSQGVYRKRKASLETFSQVFLGVKIKRKITLCWLFMIKTWWNV